MIEETAKFNLFQRVLVKELDAFGYIYERNTADSGNKIYGVRLDKVAHPKNFVATEVWHCPSERLSEVRNGTG